jgi:hypothetical protein
MYGIHTDSEGEKYIVTELMTKGVKETISRCNRCVGSAVDLIQMYGEELTIFDLLTMYNCK